MNEFVIIYFSINKEKKMKKKMERIDIKKFSTTSFLYHRRLANALNEIMDYLEELGEKVEKIEQGKKPYEDEKPFNPYDLSQIEKLKEKHNE